MLNSFGFVGYSPESAPSEKFWPATLGFEFSYPAFALTAAGEQMMLHWHVNYTTYFDDVDFDYQGPDPRITDQWELGIAIGYREKPISFWLFRFDRLGLGYRASSDGDLKGITVVLRSLFDL